MELQFDYGTLLIKLPSDWRQRSDLVQLFSNSPHWKWDSRVGTYRAPAHILYSFLAQIEALSLSCDQIITNQLTPLKISAAPLELRPYQEQAFNLWNLNRRKGVVVLPTGAGKTRLALHTILSIKVKTLILVPTRVLLYQWRDEIKARLQLTPGILGDGHKQVAPITVATYESAIRSIGMIGDQFQLVVVDEAHHFLSGERIELLEMLCAPFYLSLSATFSYSLDTHDRIKNLMGSIVFEMNLEELKGTVLAPFQKFVILINLSPVERQIYSGFIQHFRETIEKLKHTYPLLNSKELFQVLGRSSNGKKALINLRAARHIVSQCEEKIKRLSELLLRFSHRQILIFTADAETTLKISKALLIFPILAETSKGERERGIKLFIEGTISTLVTCRVLNEGFDVPSADMAIIVGGTHGEREHIQRMGRVLRSAPGKSALIYELVCKDSLEINQWRKRNHHE